MRELNTFFGGDMEKIRAAIVGTGFAAEIHARALRELGFEVAAVVGSNLSRTSAFAEKWKIEVMESISKSRCKKVSTVYTSARLRPFIM
jgi:predicted dehydrogenase